MGRKRKPRLPKGEILPKYFYMQSTRQFQNECEAFVFRYGMSVSMFGLEAIGDHKLIPRLKKGTDVTLGTAERVRAFMNAYAKHHAAGTLEEFKEEWGKQLESEKAAKQARKRKPPPKKEESGEAENENGAQA